MEHIIDKIYKEIEAVIEGAGLDSIKRTFGVDGVYMIVWFEDEDSEETWDLLEETMGEEYFYHRRCTVDDELILFEAMTPLG